MLQFVKCGQCKCWRPKPDGKHGDCLRYAPVATCVPQSMIGKATTMHPATGRDEGCYDGEQKDA